MLVIALCKGRFLSPSLDLLTRAGIRFPEDVASSRKLIFNSEDESFRAVMVKPADVPTYVEYGAADIGIAGRDVILESRADVLQPLDLKFGYCKVAVAGVNGESSQNPFPLGEGRVRVSGFDETFLTCCAPLRSCDPHPALRATLSQRERVLEFRHLRKSTA
jgi:ATP phosphoribosyltransferase